MGTASDKPKIDIEKTQYHPSLGSMRTEKTNKMQKDFSTSEQKCDLDNTEGQTRPSTTETKDIHGRGDAGKSLDNGETSKEQSRMEGSNPKNVNHLTVKFKNDVEVIQNSVRRYEDGQMNISHLYFDRKQENTKFVSDANGIEEMSEQNESSHENIDNQATDHESDVFSAKENNFEEKISNAQNWESQKTSVDVEANGNALKIQNANLSAQKIASDFEESEGEFFNAEEDIVGIDENYIFDGSITALVTFSPDISDDDVVDDFNNTDRRFILVPHESFQFEEVPDEVCSTTDVEHKSSVTDGEDDDGLVSSGDSFDTVATAEPVANIVSTEELLKANQEEFKPADRYIDVNVENCDMQKHDAFETVLELTPPEENPDEITHAYDSSVAIMQENETTPESHYYGANIQEVVTDQENNYYEDVAQYWNAGASNIEGQNDSKAEGVAEQEIRALKDQLLDMQISMNKSRVGVDFKLKTVLSDLRNDFEYWSETVGGMLDALETRWTRRINPLSLSFSDVGNYDDNKHVPSSSSVGNPSKQHQNGFSTDGDFANIHAAPSAPPYNMTCPRMPFPNRMYFPPYHGYMMRPNHLQHQQGFLMGHNIRANQFPPGHVHSHGVMPTYMGHVVPSPPLSANAYSGGTPFPNCNKMNYSPPNNNNPPPFVTGTPFPKCTHMTTNNPVAKNNSPPMMPPNNRSNTAAGGSSTTANKMSNSANNSPPLTAGSHGKNEIPQKNSKMASSSKERPKRKNNQRPVDGTSRKKLSNNKQSTG